MEQPTFDETLPWRSLPYFIQERLYWPAMVHARNQMGWKALHEQLFPFGKKLCWDCGEKLFFTQPHFIDLPILPMFSGVNDIVCHSCQTRARRKLYRVAYTHQDMFPRKDIPRYKIHVFGYLVETVYTTRKYPYINHTLLTGYHISHGIVGNKLLTRYYDEDNDYTRRRHIFRPIFLWNETRASFA